MKNEEVKKQNSINFLTVFNFLLIHTSAETENPSHYPFCFHCWSYHPVLLTSVELEIIIFVT